MDITVTPELARAIQAQMRAEGELTHQDIVDRGGPSSPTMTKILSGEGAIGPSTAKKLEKALGLQRGDIARIARGQQKRAAPTESDWRNVRLRDATTAQIEAELALRKAAVV